MVPERGRQSYRPGKQFKTTTGVYIFKGQKSI
jgi:hypothetical protein